MTKADKQIMEAHKNRFDWACQQADNLIPPNTYQRNCLDQDGSVVTVVRVSRYFSEKVLCFKLPELSKFTTPELCIK